MESEHFKRSEFACKCGCGFDAVDVVLLRVLEEIRAYFGRYVIITSGCRCKSHNRNEGGAKRSQHLIAKAVDFFVAGVPVDKVYEFLDSKYPNCFGIGKYSNRLHLDVREKKARW